jgi:hypothetical protein
MKSLWLLGVLLLGLSACAAPASSDETLPDTGATASLPDLEPAPELTNETWLNTPAPLRLAALRGKVVAIDMWTFG